MDDKSNISRLSAWIDWLFEHAINGGHYFDSSQFLADNYLALSPSKIDAAGSLINWESAKSASCGFMTGLGGALAIPLTLPVSMTSNLLIQLRMIAVVTIIGDYSVRNIRIKNLAYLYVGGIVGKDVLKAFCKCFFETTFNDSTVKQAHQLELAFFRLIPTSLPVRMWV